jgi:molybdate transport system substrate-binding protein
VGATRRIRWGGAAALLALLAPTARGGEIGVAAAASLREPLEALGQRFESEQPGTRVALAFGASSALAAQIRAGAPIDVYVCADAAIGEALEREGRLAAKSLAPVATNRLVVVEAPGLTAPLARPEDLLASGIRRIAVPDAAVPVGHYAREWLAARGLLDPLRGKLVATEHARASLAAVDAGDADAAVVYATDARTARAARVAFEIPAAEQPRIVYAVAVVAGAREGAEAFEALLRGDAGRAALAAAGFGPP